MSNIYNQNILTYRLQLSSSDSGKDINQILLARLKQDVEGKCIKEGYVRRDSVEIIERSLGKLDRSHFSGGINYDIVYKADICNPVPGMEIKCVITSINKAGAFCNVEDNDNPLQIFLATQKHYENKKFFLLKDGMKVKVRVLGRKFEYNDNHIMISAVLLSGEFEDQFVEENLENIQSSENNQEEQTDDNQTTDDEEEEKDEEEDEEEDEQEDEQQEEEKTDDDLEIDDSDESSSDDEEIKSKVKNTKVDVKKITKKVK